MIKFKSGYIDNRRVLKVYRGSGVDLRQYAIVANDNKTFEKVVIDDSYSFGPTEPIRGGILIDCFKVDATEKDYKLYDSLQDEERRKMGIFMKGDTVVIQRGRKMLGDIKIVEKSLFVQVAPKIEIHYLQFQDGTKVQSKHCDFIKKEEHNYETNIFK